MRAAVTRSQSVQRSSQVLLKVPEITVYFWIVKLLSTAMGESTSDYLVFHIDRWGMGCLD